MGVRVLPAVCRCLYGHYPANSNIDKLGFKEKPATEEVVSFHPPYAWLDAAVKEECHYFYTHPNVHLVHINSLNPQVKKLRCTAKSKGLKRGVTFTLTFSSASETINKGLTQLPYKCSNAIHALGQFIHRGSVGNAYIIIGTKGVARD
jgi:hypothetical protein